MSDWLATRDHRAAPATRRSTWRCRARTARGATRSSPPCAPARSTRPTIDDKVAAAPAPRRAGRGARTAHRRRRAPAHVATTRSRPSCARAAAAGFVLARNQRLAAAARPLGGCGASRVIGPNAAVARTLGGGSATVFPPYTVSPLHGLRAALPAVEVRHCLGVTRQRAGSRWRALPWLQQPTAAAGVQARLLWPPTAAELLSERRPGCAFHWPDRCRRCSRVATVEVQRADPRHRPRRRTPIGALGDRALPPVARRRGGARRRSWSPGRTPTSWRRCGPAAGVPSGRSSTAARQVRSRRRRRRSRSGRPPMLGVRFAAQPRAASRHRRRGDRARRRARAGRSDVAIVVVGTTEEVESEGFDRELARAARPPGRARPQRVADGEPATRSWSSTPALRCCCRGPTRSPPCCSAWFPGQEFGNALADVLLGDAEPGGRLPTTLAAQRGGPPVHPAASTACCAYDEGLLIGYRGYERGGRCPLYPFGHGLGYSSWTYVSIDAPPEARAGRRPARSTSTVRNAGARRGREVVQLYASRAVSAVQRPAPVAGRLCGRRRQRRRGRDRDDQRRARGRSSIGARHAGGWTIEPGAFQLAAGASSLELSLFSPIEIFRGETSEGHACPPPDLSSARRTPGLSHRA